MGASASTCKEEWDYLLDDASHLSSLTDVQRSEFSNVMLNKIWPSLGQSLIQNAGMLKSWFNRSLPISLVVSDFQLNPGKTPPKITSIQLRHDEESFGNLSGRLELIADVQFWYGGNLEAFLTVKSKNEKDGEACTCYLHNFQVACEMRIVCKAPLEMLTVYTAAAFSMIGVPNIKFDTRVITGADLLDALDIRRLVMSTAHDFLACTCTMPKMTIVPFIPGLSTTDTVMKPPDGVLRIEIRSAILLEDCVPPKPFQSDQQYEDVFPALEPFIRVQIGNQVYFSQVGVRQFDSSWVFQEVFEFQVHDAATENLLITIYSGHRAELIKMEEDPSKFPASGDSPVIRPIGEPAPSRVMTKDIDSAIMRSMELSHIELSVANLGAQSLQEHCTVLNSGMGAKLLFNTYWYALSRDPMYMDMQADLSKDVENSNDIPWPVGLLLVYIDSARHCGFTGPARAGRVDYPSCQAHLKLEPYGQVYTTLPADRADRPVWKHQVNFWVHFPVLQILNVTVRDTLSDIVIGSCSIPISTIFISPNLQHCGWFQLSHEGENVCSIRLCIRLRSFRPGNLSQIHPLDAVGEGLISQINAAEGVKKPTEAEMDEDYTPPEPVEVGTPMEAMETLDPLTRYQKGHRISVRDAQGINLPSNTDMHREFTRQRTAPVILLSLRCEQDFIELFIDSIAYFHTLSRKLSRAKSLFIKAIVFSDDQKLNWSKKVQPVITSEYYDALQFDSYNRLMLDKDFDYSQLHIDFELYTKGHVLVDSVSLRGLDQLSSDKRYFLNVPLLDDERQKSSSDKSEKLEKPKQSDKSSQEKSDDDSDGVKKYIYETQPVNNTNSMPAVGTHPPSSLLSVIRKIASALRPGKKEMYTKKVRSATKFAPSKSKTESSERSSAATKNAPRSAEQEKTSGEETKPNSAESDQPDKPASTSQEPKTSSEKKSKDEKSERKAKFSDSIEAQPAGTEESAKPEEAQPGPRKQRSATKFVPSSDRANEPAKKKSASGTAEKAKSNKSVTEKDNKSISSDKKSKKSKRSDKESKSMAKSERPWMEEPPRTLSAGSIANKDAQNSKTSTRSTKSKKDPKPAKSVKITPASGDNAQDSNQNKPEEKKEPKPVKSEAPQLENSTLRTESRALTSSQSHTRPTIFLSFIFTRNQNQTSTLSITPQRISNLRGKWLPIDESDKAQFQVRIELQPTDLHGFSQKHEPNVAEKYVTIEDEILFGPDFAAAEPNWKETNLYVQVAAKSRVVAVADISLINVFPGQVFSDTGSIQFAAEYALTPPAQMKKSAYYKEMDKMKES